MRVLKFGGTSMADEHTWEQVLDIISRYEHPLVVVSATALTTRALRRAAAYVAEGQMERALEETAGIKSRHLSLVREFVSAREHPEAEAVQRACETWIDEHIRELTTLLEEIRDDGELSARRLDAVSSYGERISARLIAECGRLRGLATHHIDARRVMKTSADFGRARPDTEAIERESAQLRQWSDEGRIPVVGGYYGETADGIITTLGLEGSDYTASLLGAALDAEAVEIWTDVTGIYTSDPRYIEGARPIEHLDYREAAELAHFGAKVLHPSTIEPAAEKNIPVWVRNMFEAHRPGTRICAESQDQPAVKGLAFKDDISVLRIEARERQDGPDFMADIFETLKAHGLAADVLTASGLSLSIAFEEAQLWEKLVKDLQAVAEVEVHRELGLISLVGYRLEEDAGLSGKALGALAETSVRLIAFGSSSWSFSVAVSSSDMLDAARRLHAAFFPAESASFINSISEKARS